MHQLVFFILLVIISIRKVTSREDMKEELLATLKRLQNVLNDLESNRFVIIDMTKNRKLVQNKSVKLINSIEVKEQIKNSFKPQEKSRSKTALEKTVTLEPSQMERRVICYINMSQKIPERLQKYSSPVKGLNSTLCTHVILKDYVHFISTGNNTVSVDFDPALSTRYSEIKELQSNGISVLTSLKDDNTMEFCHQFRLAVSSKGMRTNIINNIILTLKKHGLNGFDMEWTHPGCCKSSCAIPTKTVEKPNFTSFLKELYIQAKKNQMFISLVLRPGHVFFTQFYEFPELLNYLDWVSVPAFDTRGPWESKTGHASPTSHASETIKSALRGKIDAKKILLGIPFYARTYNLKNAKARIIGSPSVGFGIPGKILKLDGMMAYFEVCDDVRQIDWKIVRSASDGSYATHDTQWISYVDANSIRYRIDSMKSLGVDGVAVWDMDLDDYANICKCGQYPLLHAVNNLIHPECA